MWTSFGQCLITKRSYRDKISKGISYIGSLDTTITGSRNGHSPLFLWYAIKKLDLEGLRKRYEHSVEIAQYCKTRLNEVGVAAWTNPGAITVVFPKTSNQIKSKWQLATEEDVTHIICMPNVTKVQIDAFMDDVVKLSWKEQRGLGLTSKRTICWKSNEG